MCPKKSALVFALSTRILHVASLFKWSFERESRHLGLNPGESLVLDTLRRQGPPYVATPAQLKKHFLLSFGGIGKRIKRLEQLGYVQRSAHVSDGRSQLIRLTPTGLGLLLQPQEGIHSPHTRALMQLPADELESLSRILKKVQKGIEQARP